MDSFLRCGFGLSGYRHSQKSPPQSKINILTLPNEILDQIFAYMADEDPPEWLSQVCPSHNRCAILVKEVKEVSLVCWQLRDLILPHLFKRASIDFIFEDASHENYFTDIARSFCYFVRHNNHGARIESLAFNVWWNTGALYGRERFKPATNSGGHFHLGLIATSISRLVHASIFSFANYMGNKSYMRHELILECERSETVFSPQIPASRAWDTAQSRARDLRFKLIDYGDPLIVPQPGKSQPYLLIERKWARATIIDHSSPFPVGLIHPVSPSISARSAIQIIIVQATASLMSISVLLVTILPFQVIC